MRKGVSTAIYVIGFCLASGRISGEETAVCLSQTRTNINKPTDTYIKQTNRHIHADTQAHIYTQAHINENTQAHTYTAACTLTPTNTFTYLTAAPKSQLIKNGKVVFILSTSHVLPTSTAFRLGKQTRNLTRPFAYFLIH